MNSVSLRDAVVYYVNLQQSSQFFPTLTTNDVGDHEFLNLFFSSTDPTSNLVKTSLAFYKNMKNFQKVVTNERQPTYKKGWKRLPRLHR